MIDHLTLELEQLAAAGRLRECHAAERSDDTHVQLRGKSVVDFANWDILRLRNHRKVKRAIQAEIETQGLGPSSPRLIAGTDDLHLVCEKRIAQFFGLPDALLFASRNQAVLSLFTALCSERDLVIIDDSLTSPVADAAYLVNAQVVSANVKNLQRLREELEKGKNARKRYVVIESVSSLTGELANLAEIQSVTQQNGAELIIDETYAIGMLGLRGAGGSEMYHLGVKNICLFGDLSLAAGAHGAFIAGSQLLMRYLLNRSYTFRNEASFPAALTAGTLTALDLMELMPVERKRANDLAQVLRSKLCALGLACADEPNLPLACVRFAKFSVAVEYAEALFQKGFLVESLSEERPLSTGGVLRFLVSAAHTAEQIDDAARAMREVYARLGS